MTANRRPGNGHDSEFEIVTDLGDTIPVTDEELDLIEAHLSSLVRAMLDRDLN